MEEVLDVIGLTYLVGIHTVTNGTRILLELQEELNMSSPQQPLQFDPDRQRIKDEFICQRGFWTDTWNPILELNPSFFEAYSNFSSQSVKANVLEPKVRELITCAFDASTTHLYHLGTKIHMRNALNLGATPGEIIEMLEIVSLQGIDGVSLAAAVLSAELN
jgi:alkylhydroperoxidase/carboxymuconolactone decarboxylase family protein YurZ